MVGGFRSVILERLSSLLVIINDISIITCLAPTSRHQPKNGNGLKQCRWQNDLGRHALNGPEQPGQTIQVESGQDRLNDSVEQGQKQDRQHIGTFRNPAEIQEEQYPEVSQQEEDHGYSGNRERLHTLNRPRS